MKKTYIFIATAALGSAALIAGCGSSPPGAAPDAAASDVAVPTNTRVGVTVAAVQPSTASVEIQSSAAVSADSHAHRVPLFPAASDTLRQGFVRVINHTDDAGEVSIEAIDDEANVRGPIALSIDAGQTMHFNSGDLEEGNPDKGLSGNAGGGEGDWRLQLASDLDIEVLAYVRTNDGFLTAMHDLVPETEEGYRVPTFNPGRNANQVSRLRLINPGNADATVTVHGIDDNGDRSKDAEVIVPSGAARTFTVQQLESGSDGLTGRMDPGTGKWQLMVAADGPIQVMSLLASPTGHLTNLSTAPARDGDAFTVPMLPAYLVPGFYRPTRGRVLVDGGDILGVNLASLRRQVSYVFQEHLLMSESIRSNFHLVNPAASEADRRRRRTGAPPAVRRRRSSSWTACPTVSTRYSAVPATPCRWGRNSACALPGDSSGTPPY